MKKYVALYMAPVEEMDEMMNKMKSMEPEEKKKADQEMNEGWMKWMKAHEKNFVDQGAPTGKNKRVMKNGVRDVRNEVTGYSVVQANSHDEAAKMFEDNPMLEMPGAYVEVLEWVEMPE